MNRLRPDDERIQQLRAIEAELLRSSSPVPQDPVQSHFQFGYVRAASIKKSNGRRAPLAPIHNPVFRQHENDNEEEEAPIEPQRHQPRRRSLRLRNAAAGVQLQPPPPPGQRGIRRQLGDDEINQHEPMRLRRRPENRVEEERRNINEDGMRNRREDEEESNEEEEIRRPLSPTELPGVRAIPKEYNRMFRGLLTPGEYFAKSHSRYLGPFDNMPTLADLPAQDNYIILQRMGRLPESGKSIFRQVGTLLT
ncbi:unnamed protein product [Caenorhabditis angaria]|uniref:Uncharacterized protein n=1 Tax=Caenorhabditis angaria TaxID=860376 RepID=A0A9P1IUI9_9PELO|nr:unnamed protein product [Caenorhabditis angaria]